MPLERIPPEERQSWISEAIILVGSIPCYMPMQHPWEAESSRQALKHEEASQSMSRTNPGGDRKGARAMSNAGQEIVGHAYSAWPPACTTRRVERWMPRSPKNASTEDIKAGSKAEKPSKKGSVYNALGVGSPKPVSRAPAPR
jgi:hypothetical protein